MKKMCSTIRNIIFYLLIVLVGLFVTKETFHIIRARKEIEAKQFIGNIIESAVNKSDFCRNHTDSKVFEAITNNFDNLSLGYRILVVDYTFGNYEGIITFDNGKEYWFDFSYKDKTLNIFRPYVWPKVDDKM